MHGSSIEFDGKNAGLIFCAIQIYLGCFQISTLFFGGGEVYAKKFATKAPQGKDSILEWFLMVMDNPSIIYIYEEYINRPLYLELI